MSKKGIALLLALLILAVLVILGSSLFISSLTESNLTKRDVRGKRAFWAAESGISKGIEKLKECAQSGDCQVSGTIDYENESYSYFATISVLDSLNYRVDSSGFLGQITKNISAVVRLRDIDANNFPYAIETEGLLDIGGSAQITPSDSTKEQSSLNFNSLFTFTKEELKSYADYTYTDPPNNITPCEGITWVDVSPDNEFRITSDSWEGSGILVIQGNVKITGGRFRGIIYIIGGRLEVPLEVAAGNPLIEGAILVECMPTSTTQIRGNFTLNYDLDAINEALDNLRFIAPQIVAWWEGS